MSSKVWYRDDSDENLSELHKTDPPEYLGVEELFKKTGVRYEKIPDSVCEDHAALERFPSERKYKFHDFCDLNEETNKQYYGEHLHDDPEIRLVIGGGGFFEVRSTDDRWVRIHVEKGDLLELPPGIWHRLALDKRHSVSMLRLFSETPVWRADWRAESENPPARERYREVMAVISKQHMV